MYDILYTEVHFNLLISIFIKDFHKNYVAKRGEKEINYSFCLNLDKVIKVYD